MSKKKVSGATGARATNSLSPGVIIWAKSDFTAVPADGSRGRIRIAAGTEGLVEEGVVKAAIEGEPDFGFFSFEQPNGGTVCVSADPALVTNSL